MKNILSFCFAYLFVSFLLLTVNVNCQLTQLQQQYDWVMPQLSPQATLSQRIGVTDIKIVYHRPFAKGREIWGKIVPYDAVWRAGANEATTISFSTDINIEGKNLPAGTYGLFMLPKVNEWEIIFNKVSVQWGAFTYKSSEDVLRVIVKPQPTEFQEALEYRFSLLSPDSGQIILSWEKLKVPISISTNTSQLAIEKANKTFNWQTAYFAANYFFTNKTDLNEGLKWANVMTVLEENYSTLLLKARILGELKRTQEAIQTAEKAIEINKSAKVKAPTTIAEKLIADLKALQPKE